MGKHEFTGICFSSTLVLTRLDASIIAIDIMYHLYYLYISTLKEIG